MKKKFNRSEILKSSGNCYKFSKSVSYETRVGGTATIGRDYKQIRRLFLGDANKPLIAIGTLISLLCNSAKVKESLLQTLPVFRLIKVFSLLTVLSVGTLSESSAKVIASGDDCGEDCHWVLDDKGNMQITGSGAMYNYPMTLDPGPWKWYNESPWKSYAEDITSVDIQGISYIGDGAFGGTLNNLTHVNIGNTITHIGAQAFDTANLSSVKLPDSLEVIDSWAFSGNLNMSSIEIPDSVTSIGSGAFWSSSPTSITIPDSTEINGNFNFGANLANTKITCRGSKESCTDLYNKLKHYCVDTGGTGCDVESDFINLSNNFNLADETNCDTANYYWNGKICIREENPQNRECVGGYVMLKEKCVDPLKRFAKKHYTPAEANEWLHDGNDNFVIITFKK
jgi:hypothetical protein